MRKRIGLMENHVMRYALCYATSLLCNVKEKDTFTTHVLKNKYHASTGKGLRALTASIMTEKPAKEHVLLLFILF